MPCSFCFRCSSDWNEWLSSGDPRIRSYGRFTTSEQRELVSYHQEDGNDGYEEGTDI